MASVDLLFKGSPLANPADLVFGDDGSAPISDATVSASIAIRRPVLVGLVRAAQIVSGVVQVTRTLTIVAEIEYFTDTRRPLVGKTTQRFQDGVECQAGTQGAYDDARALPAHARQRYQDATPLPRANRGSFKDATRVPIPRRARYQDGQHRRNPTGFRYQDSTSIPLAKRARFADAIGLQQPTPQRFQDGIRLRNPAAGRFQDGVRYSFGIRGREGYGTPLRDASWNRYQDAIRPPPGLSPDEPPIPPGHVCYIPDPDLLFHGLAATDGNLIFVCEEDDVEPPAGVVVPIRKVYIVINSATLIRVSDGKVIPTNAMRLSLDADSWAWSFNASVPYSAFSDIEWLPGGEPVEVQATVNGTHFRFLVENISRDRAFGSDALQINGRGRTALLDAPYAPIMSFFNDTARTAQQLANDALTESGVPLGWDVNWALTDWLVPADTFSFQGSYIGAVLRIAEAGGAYVQPHRTDDEIFILPRYPSAPWEWGSVSPDFELPSSVTQREGIEWAMKPRYNRVYVSGEAVGVLGQVTRTGTAGDLLAPMVVDSLITHADAARQRGLPVLADVGRIARVSLRLPVLAETGIITPGKFIRYVDGTVERIGIARSVAVDVGLPAVYQTIEVETHDEPV